MSDSTNLSPPFRDSDGIRIIIRRLEIIEDQMRKHNYGAEMEKAMGEVSDWLQWIVESVYTRNDKGGES